MWKNLHVVGERWEKKGLGGVNTTQHPKKTMVPRSRCCVGIAKGASDVALCGDDLCIIARENPKF